MLKTILERAKDYYNPTAPTEYQEISKKKFLKCCQRYNLDSEFEKQYSENQIWQNLAQKSDVFFFIDYRRDTHITLEQNPEIFLRIFEQGTKPVVKLLCRENDLNL